MADQECVERLLTSISESNGCQQWNEWAPAYRKQRLPTYPATEEHRNHTSKRSLADIKTFYISKATIHDPGRIDLRGIDLSRKDLSGVQLVGVNLAGANLSGSKLVGGNLSSTNLAHANLNKAQLSGANLSFATLVGTTMRGTRLSELNLSNTTFINVSLAYREIIMSNLRGAKFIDCDLRHCNFNMSNMIRTLLSNTNLTGARIYEIHKDSWHLHNLTCDYIYISPDKKKRLPIDRDFEDGEFESIYASYPSFEYFFKYGMHPLSPWAADQIVNQIREETGLNIEIESLNALGAMPSIKVRVHNQQDLPLSEKMFTEKMEPVIEMLQQLTGNGPKQLTQVFNFINSQGIQIGDHGVQENLLAHGEKS